jgi:hypothetical protein
MHRTFIYSSLFLKRLEGQGDSGDKCRQIENEILNNPEVGDIVAGTGGVRKFRVSDANRGKGKRGGIRVFFLDLSHVAKTHILFLLYKGEAADLNENERKAIRELVLVLKKESKP